MDLTEFLYIIASIFFIALPEVSYKASEMALSALKNVVIRSLFPMMVLSRLVAHSRAVSSLLERIADMWIWRRLEISSELLPAVVTGYLSGLPASAREIGKLKREGRVTAEEASKAIALSSVPSPAFVILAASETASKGIVRYLLLTVTAYAVTLLFRSEKSKGRWVSNPMPLPDALSSSALSAIAVSANIIFFSALTCLVSCLLPSFKGVTAAILEMGSGVSLAGDNAYLAAFALGWRGLSALSQIRSESDGISLIPYISVSTASAVILPIAEYFF